MGSGFKRSVAAAGVVLFCTVGLGKVQAAANLSA
jgi:hypothetical protein